LLIPAGDWAEWVGALLAGGSLIGLVVSLRGERSARRQDLADAETERRRHQASLVGAWIEPHEGTSDGRTWHLYVINSSDLPIRQAVGYLFQLDGTGVDAFEPMRVVPPHQTYSTAITLDPPVQMLRLVVAFNDEATIRWRKHMHDHLEEIPPRTPDIGPDEVPTLQFGPGGGR
jgi:hypothetical protein